MVGGKRQNALRQAFKEVLASVGHRVLPFDAAAAQQAGDLMATRQKKGRPVELRDTMIAGIVLVQRATLATRNTSHFDDISTLLIDPWIV